MVSTRNTTQREFLYGGSNVIALREEAYTPLAFYIIQYSNTISGYAFCMAITTPTHACCESPSASTRNWCVQLLLISLTVYS